MTFSGFYTPHFPLSDATLLEFTDIENRREHVLLLQSEFKTMSFKDRNRTLNLSIYLPTHLWLAGHVYISFFFLFALNCA